MTFDSVDKWAIENELLNKTIKELLILFLVLNDGYCINIKQQNPATDAKTNKNISSKN
jgi:hypothetical protein